MTKGIKFRMMLLRNMLKIKNNSFFNLLLFLILANWIVGLSPLFGFELSSPGISFDGKNKNIQTLGQVTIKHRNWNIKAKSGTLNALQQHIIAKDVTAIHPKIFVWSNSFKFLINQRLALINTPSISNWEGYKIESKEVEIDYSKNAIFFNKGSKIAYQNNTLLADQIHISLDHQTLLAKNIVLTLNTNSF